MTSTQPTNPFGIDDYGPPLRATAGGSTHTHTVGISSKGGSDSGVVTMDSESSEPSWEKINLIQNDTGGDSLPDQIIEFWYGTEASM